MVTTSFWVNGTIVQAEYQERLEKTERKADGSTFFGKQGTDNWFHTTITTPVLLNDINSILKQVNYLYNAGNGVRINQVHIYDGKKKVWSGDIDGSGDHSNKIEIGKNASTTQPSNPIIIKYGLGISLHVIFDNVPNNDHSIMFATVGADFETP